jgi:MFS family permease
MSAVSETPDPSAQSLRGLDWLNFFLADVQTGVGPFVATFLATRGWRQENIGWSLTVSGLVGVICQAPAGALVDWSRYKRTLVAAAILIIAAGALVLALWPSYWPVMLAQASHGAIGSVVGPTVAAVSLGIVGYKKFGVRNGRNKQFDSAGNIAAAVLMGWIGYQFSTQAIFFATAAFAVPALFSLGRIRPDEIDYARARGALEAPAGQCAGTVAKEGIFLVFQDRRLLLFAGCAVMFHFANAAMLPLLGEMLAHGRAVRSAPALLSACIITTQVIVMLLATLVGRRANAWGRKPLLLIGFGVLPIRGLLYTLTDHPTLLVAIQILDGIGAVVFGVVSVLVIADLTRGSGRFNLAQSAIGAAVGVGASLSNAVAGWIVQRAGFNAGFLFLAGVAAVATALFWLFMPETQNLKEWRAT